MKIKFENTNGSADGFVLLFMSLTSDLCTLSVTYYL